MSQFSQILHKSAEEARDFRRTSSSARAFEDSWLETLAHRLDFASTLEDDAAAEREIDSIAHSLLDSGPTGNDFAPSFHQLRDALQRKRKRSEGKA